jgi:hypothetical protein
MNVLTKFSAHVAAVAHGGGEAAGSWVAMDMAVTADELVSSSSFFFLFAVANGGLNWLAKSFQFSETYV